MEKLKFHYNAGHGWLEVSKELYRNIMKERILSNYSYEDNNNYYLEKDCDASDFLRVYKGEKSLIWNESIIEIDDGDSSFIRDLKRIGE